MEKKKKTKKKLSKKFVTRIVAVCSAVVVLCGALVIPTSASGWSDIRWFSWTGTGYNNNMQISSLTFQKLPTPGFENSAETVPIGLPVYNINNGVLSDNDVIIGSVEPSYDNGIYFHTSTSDTGETTTGCYLYYDSYEKVGKAKTGCYINQLTYNLYMGGIYDQNDEIVNTNLTLYHQLKIKAPITEIYFQPNDVQRNLSEFYFYFASDSINGDYELLNPVTNQNNTYTVDYDVCVPYENYDGGTESTTVGYKKLFHVGYQTPIVENGTIYPFFILQDSDAYREQLPTNKPIYITNLEVTVDLYGKISSTYPNNFVYRFNIGMPMSYHLDMNGLLNRQFVVDNNVENVLFEDFSMVNWAVTQLTSLVAVELFLGVSIGDIVWFCMGIAMLFFLLKLFLGG